VLMYVLMQNGSSPIVCISKKKRIMNLEYGLDVILMKKRERENSRVTVRVT
jgi:hypothetical protein